MAYCLVFAMPRAVCLASSCSSRVGGTRYNEYNLSGNDTLRGDAGNDTLDGLEGSDVLYGGRGNDVVDGGATLDRYGLADSLYGGSGRDQLYGRNGDDFLDGGSGKDSLYGGHDDDTLVGGSGSDRFIFKGDIGNDVVRDFDATNDAEKIDLSLISHVLGFRDLSRNHMSQVGEDVVIDLREGDQLTLQNVDLTDLDRADFLF